MSVIKLTNENFEKEVLNSEVPVLVDFYATWCGPCRILAPTIEELGADANGAYKVGKLDINESEEIAEKYKVLSVPTLVLYTNGKVTSHAVGVHTKKDIIEMFGL